MERNYIVNLWPGCGYCLASFNVTAFSEEEALCLVVAQLIKENQTDFYEELESDYIQECKEETAKYYGLAVDELEDDPEGWMYIDATMEGASRPVYVRTENMSIQVA